MTVQLPLDTVLGKPVIHLFFRGYLNFNIGGVNLCCGAFEKKTPIGVEDNDPLPLQAHERFVDRPPGDVKRVCKLLLSQVRSRRFVLTLHTFDNADRQL